MAMYDLEHWYDYDEYDELGIFVSNKAYAVKKICDDICDYFLNEKATIRMVEKELCIPRSTIHRYIHTYIKRYYDEEYCQIVRLLRYNKQYRTKPRKYWRGCPW